MSDSFITLPPVWRIAWWNSLGRAPDPFENWRELWSIQMAAHEDDPTNKDLTDIEIQTIRLILEDQNWPLPELTSLHDHRKALYKQNCNDAGLSEEDQMLALFNRVFGEDVWVPKKYTLGDNGLYHCYFNNCPREELTNTFPDTTCYRKLHLVKIGDNTFFGLKSTTEELITWSYTIPTVADFSALTIRALMRFRNVGAVTFGPLNTSNLGQNGIWALSKDGSDKINFSVHDGTSLKTIVSDDTLNNEIIEIFAIVDDTTIKMYIDGVLQADTAALVAAPDYYSEDKIYIGDPLGAGNNFKGTMFELAIDAEVITP
jgi:hypothetical protein